ncbi:MAG TPA: tetratricopeptide repeat protein, partial [Burkholderiaceae bacterium]|nr:tetratricopeptide repeat protein [Burkholderiaceae bacterium]
TVFNFQTDKIPARRFLIGFFAVTVAIPAFFVLAFIASHPAWLPSSYGDRSFTLTERVMTEPRIIWLYLYEIVVPNLTQMGLFHDDIVNSQGLLTPVTTLFSLLGIAALFTLSWFARKKAPLVTFGILFFLLGHALESSVFALEITFEHRNYLPMLGILFPMFFYLLYPLKYTGNLRLRQFAALLFITLCTYDTWTRSSAWSNSFALAESEVEHHPNSARNNGQMGNNYANITTADPNLNDAYYLRARHYYEQSIVSDPNYTTGLFALIIASDSKGKHIDPAWINELEHRLKTASLQSDIGDQLLTLINCQMEQRCKLSQHDMSRLMKAPLENPRVVGGKRALIYSSLSFYFVDIAVDYPAALDAMHQSVALAPQELEFRSTLVKFLIAYRRPEEAKRELDILKRMDSLGAFTKQIAAQEKLIADQESIKQH